MFQFVQNYGTFSLVGLMAIVLLAMGCAPASPAPTQTPLPTYTPYPTATPQPTYTPYPTPASGPTAARKPLSELTEIPTSTSASAEAATPTQTPRPVPSATPTPIPEPTATSTPAPTPTATPTPQPTATPTPILTPTPRPTATPTSIPTVTPTPFLGNWISIQDEINPLTRTREVAIALSNADGGPHPFWLIRCQKSELDFIIAWMGPNTGSPITESFRIAVLHRIDNEPIRELQWSRSTNGVATYLPDEEEITVIQKLFNANEFVVQVTPDKSGPLTAEFEPAGLYWSVKPVLEACGQELN